MLTLVQGFNDADYDDSYPPNTLFQWFNNGVPIPGESLGALMADPDDGFGGDIITVTVRPATDPELTDPAVGKVFSSGQYRVPPGRIMSRFLRPGGRQVSHSHAKSNCEAQRARLPTVKELQKLYIDTTRARVAPSANNNDFQDLYGWPAAAGGGNYYWASNSNEAVLLYNGQKVAPPPGNYASWDACIKD